MPISDPGPGELRVSRTYRAAVWATRITYAWMLVWVVSLGVSRMNGAVILLVWVAGLPSSVAMLVLLRRCGARVFRHRNRWFADPETQRQFNRDVLWLPRR